MYTTTEAARALGLSPSTLRWQIKNGRIKARKNGRDWLISVEEVDRYRRDVRKDGGA